MPRSQIFTVLSSEPDATQVPSGEKATQRTRSEWPQSDDLTRPVSRSQITTAVPLAVASDLPSGEKVTALTGPDWPRSESVSP